MGGIIIGILLSLGILLAIILLAPIHLEVSGEHAEGFNFLGRFNWVWGLLSIEIIRSKGIYHLVFGWSGTKSRCPKTAKQPLAKNVAVNQKASQLIWQYIRLPKPTVVCCSKDGIT